MRCRLSGSLGSALTSRSKLSTPRFHIAASSSGRPAIDRRPFRHQRVHVRDGHQDADASVRLSLGPLQLIEVHRVGVVDTGPEQAPEVVHVGRSRRPGALQGGDLRVAIVREVGKEAQLEHRSPGAVLQVKGHAHTIPEAGACVLQLSAVARPAGPRRTAAGCPSCSVARRRPGVQER